MSDEGQQQELSAKEAVQRAIQQIQDLYEGTPVGDLLLEEVERSGSNWLVTISFVRPAGRGAGIGAGIGAIMGTAREYKRVRIDASTGDFEGMEIRTLPAPPKPERSSLY